MYQRSGTLYGIFCKSAARWAAIQHQTSVQPLDHARTAMRGHTHTQRARLNICPAGSVPFWSMICADCMRKHTPTHTQKMWLLRYFVPADGHVTANSSIDGQQLFYRGRDKRGAGRGHKSSSSSSSKQLWLIKLILIQIWTSSRSFSRTDLQPQQFHAMHDIIKLSCSILYNLLTSLELKNMLNMFWSSFTMSDPTCQLWCSLSEKNSVLNKGLDKVLVPFIYPLT